MRVEMIDDPRRFNDLRNDWTRLLENSPNDSLTVTWEWLSSWWQAYGAARHLRIIAIWDDNKLVGAAPLLARRTPQRHFSAWFCRNATRNRPARACLRTHECNRHSNCFRLWEIWSNT